MSEFLLKNLKETHTIDGEHIRIDDSSEALDLTAELIESDAEADFECIVEQLRESDELTALLTGIVKRSAVDGVMGHIGLEALAESILKETIERKLRAEL